MSTQLHRYRQYVCDQGYKGKSIKIQQIKETLSRRSRVIICHDNLIPILLVLCRQVIAGRNSLKTSCLSATYGSPNGRLLCLTRKYISL